jgi:hypothetical protein
MTESHDSRMTVIVRLTDDTPTDLRLTEVTAYMMVGDLKFEPTGPLEVESDLRTLSNFGHRIARLADEALVARRAAVPALPGMAVTK